MNYAKNKTTTNHQYCRSMPRRLKLLHINRQKRFDFNPQYLLEPNSAMTSHCKLITAYDSLHQNTVTSISQYQPPSASSTFLKGSIHQEPVPSTIQTSSIHPDPVVLTSQTSSICQNPVPPTSQTSFISQDSVVPVSKTSSIHRDVVNLLSVMLQYTFAFRLTINYLVVCEPSFNSSMKKKTKSVRKEVELSDRRVIIKQIG